MTAPNGILLCQIQLGSTATMSDARVVTSLRDLKCFGSMVSMTEGVSGIAEDGRRKGKPLRPSGYPNKSTTATRRPRGRPVERSERWFALLASKHAQIDKLF